MKTTIILIFLTCGCFVSLYSQINHNHKSDTTWNDVSIFKYDIKPSLGNENRNTLNGSLNNMTFHKFGPTERNQTSKWNAKILSPDSMPCYKPEGEFAMKIVTPDSTTTYTMLIKKY